MRILIPTGVGLVVGIAVVGTVLIHGHHTEKPSGPAKSASAATAIAHSSPTVAAVKNPVSVQPCTATGAATPASAVLLVLPTSYYGVNVANSGSTLYGLDLNLGSAAVTPYYVLGPGQSTCTAVFTGDGGLLITMQSTATGTTVYQAPYPGGAGTVRQGWCADFPELVTSASACDSQPDSSRKELSLAAPLPHVWLVMSKAAPGDTRELIENIEGASVSTTYTTWQLAVAYTSSISGTQSVPGYMAADCTAPPTKEVMCRASLEYFLAVNAEDVLKFGKFDFEPVNVEIAQYMTQ